MTTEGKPVSVSKVNITPDDPMSDRTYTGTFFLISVQYINLEAGTFLSIIVV
jgi:hypothetical protein